MARTVLDVATALDAIAGYEPGDHHWLPEPPRSFAEAAHRPAGHVSIRVALQAPMGVPVDDEPRDAARRAAASLADLGHDVQEESPDWEDDTFADAWSTFVTTVMQHIIRVLERLHGRPIDPERLEPATREWLADQRVVDAIAYLEAHEHLRTFSRRVLRAWPADRVVVTPTLTRLPLPIGTEAKAGVTDDAVRFSVLVRIWNVTGQPAISLPLHRTPDGVPVGVQLVGPPGREDLLLALATQLEESIGWTPSAPHGELAAKAGK
jgi:amidase